ncbi:enterochelin esterase [Pectobacterium parmentieri]|uniref:enterochelin esterase n=1 Tax=Pectobacterium parmentieri TaxID=1905730 RepID=UPI0018E19025|nr:enterochelin esterase [Pectobacterium parmentieri]QQA76738.1 enterochelin esterase [Pectobacterium parmentieri]
MQEKHIIHRAAVLLASPFVGEAEWWHDLARIGTPVVEPCGEKRVQITFFWRDPEGTEQHSTIQRVYIDINGVTDHHSAMPQSLQRLAGTDVWHWSTDIESDWRGSYSLLPIRREQLPPVFADECEQREWWCSLFPHAIADPLNLVKPFITHWGESLSAAHMPDAPPQAAWHALDVGQVWEADPSRLHVFSWQSTLLGNVRRIWLYTTGEGVTPSQCPLSIILDGQKWAEEMPLFQALDEETRRASLPPAVWLFIDVIDMSYREQELTCNKAFWLAVQEELLPLAKQYASFSDEPDRTVVSGQSYGGLSALFAGIFWPQRFGRVLTQSGSFWWPNVEWVTHFSENLEQDEGWLITQARQPRSAVPPLVIFQDVGTRETDMAFVNRQMNQALCHAGHQIHYREYAGGHDTLCWRGGLIDGFRWLLSDANAVNKHTQTEQGEDDEPGTAKSF